MMLRTLMLFWLFWGALVGKKKFWFYSYDSYNLEPEEKVFSAVPISTFLLSAFSFSFLPL